MRDTHYRHSVEFLGDAHNAELRRDSRTGPACNEDRGKHRTELADETDAEYVDDKGVRAKQLQLLSGKIAEYDADEKSNERCYAQCLRAGTIDVGRNFLPWNPRRMREPGIPVSMTTWPSTMTIMTRWSMIPRSVRPLAATNHKRS